MRKDKEVAIDLRRQGNTYNHINKVLGVPKSTLSGWFRSIEVSPEIKRELYTRSQRIWAENITAYNKKRSREIAITKEKQQTLTAKEIGPLSKRELLLVGAALYWAEGAKVDRWTFKFCNSDPSMIRLVMKFLRIICSIREEKLRARIQIYPNISETEAKSYWSRITDIPPSQFQKTYTAVSKSSKFKRPSNKLPYGTATIAITDVNLVNKIKGWMKGLSIA